MLKRFGNVGTIVVSLVVFAIAFIALLAIGSMQKPETVDVIVASRDLNIGDVISPDNVTTKTIVKDDNAVKYIPVNQADKYYGGVITLPFYTGQPVYASAVVTVDQNDSRIVAVTQKYGDGVIFPLALDEPNIVSPDVTSFMPGDVIGVSVVIGTRPQAKPTPMPEVPYGYLGQPLMTQPTAIVAVAPEPTKEKTPLEEALDRVYPPIAKDLFPGGLKVISVQGLPDKSDSEASSSVVLSQTQKRPVLLILVPKNKIEEFSLSLQQASRVYVTLMARGTDGQTYGYSYWDFEEDAIKERDALFTPEPTPTPRP